MDRPRLGPYEIRDKIGAGGMGEVYLAVDPRLGREVAIKVLPAEFAVDAERLARFEQEARAAAALNHPHIAAIHDIGVDDGVHYMVQEYLRGQTLGEDLGAGRMALARILELSVEIAEALGAAHAAGIVHRDLKPANVFVTEQGHAKVLDFGLAKLADLTPVGSADDSKTQSPTVLGTVAGQVMGTAGYMAPEQIEGGDIDGRADVFAFGCVLYEMLAGKRPFKGRSLMQTLDLIVHEDPAPLSASRAGLPLRLQWVLDKCLAKDPSRRYQDAEDLVVDLRWIAAAGPEEEAAVPTPAARGSTRGISFAAAIVAGLVLVAATAALTAAWRSGPSSVPATVMNLEFPLPAGVDFSSLGRHAVSIDDAGTTVAFTAGDQIWIRPLGDTAATPVRGTEDGGRAPTFSADGRDILFWRDGALLRVPTTGGSAQQLVVAQNPWGARWQPDGWILYGQGPEGIWRVRSAGGDPELVLPMPAGQLAHGPQQLPDGRMLYTRRPQGEAWDRGEVVVQSPGETDPEILIEEGRDARWLAAGYLVYAQGSEVYARRWDATTGTHPGPATLVASGVQTGREITGAAHFDISGTGSFVYIPGNVVVEEGHELLWRHRDGSDPEIRIGSLPIEGYAMSNDGTRIAVTIPNSNGSAIWIYDLALAAGSQLVVPGYLEQPVWSADDRWIYYAEAQIEFGYGDIYRVPSDGSGGAESVIIGEGDFKYTPESVSADGRTLVVGRARTDTNFVPDVVLYDLESGAFEPVADTDAGEFNGRISPDGRYVVYARAQSLTGAATQLLIRDLESGATYPVSAAVSSYSRWSSSGEELFYVREGQNEADAMMSVRITRGERLQIGTPALLFRLDISLGNAREFFVAPDNEHLLYAELAGSSIANVQRQVRVVVNWLDELRTRVVPE